MKKINNEGLEMDMTTYKKIKGTLDPKTPIKITGDKPINTPISEDTPEAVIEPQDDSTIKYLSNVKDENGEVSKPFIIGGKNYQMIRGIKPSKEVVMAVYCHDDLNENGENLIYDIETFEGEIAQPAKIQQEQSIQAKISEKSQPKIEEPKIDNSLKLSEFKHFVIDTKTGKVRKFKRAEELAKANMTDTEKYMNLKQFKQHVDETLFGGKQRKSSVNEEEPLKDKPDVSRAINQMVMKIKPYMDKINEPVEKIQLIVKLTQMLKLDTNKFSLLISNLKKANTNSFSTPPVSESKIITKNELIESMIPKPINKIIKVKDIK